MADAESAVAQAADPVVDEKEETAGDAVMNTSEKPTSGDAGDSAPTSGDDDDDTAPTVSADGPTPAEAAAAGKDAVAAAAGGSSESGSEAADDNDDDDNENGDGDGDVEVDFFGEPVNPHERRKREQRKRYRGVCKWFDKDREFGFIECTDPEINTDVWVHLSNIEDENEEQAELVQHQECTFEVIKRPPNKNNPAEGDRYSAKVCIPGEKPKREERPPAKRHKGVCVFFNEAKDKRFGFIRVDETPDSPAVEIFVHADSLTKGNKLVQGQEVEFEIQEQAGGKLRAVKVKPGAAPEDPYKGEQFTGKVRRWVDDKKFGFIAVDPKPPKFKEIPEVMVHVSNIKGTTESLTPSQYVKFGIAKRIPRGARVSEQTKDGKERLDAIDVIPGEVPKKQVLQGVVRFFDAEKGFGFIEHKNTDYFVHQQQIIAAKPEDAILEEKQLVTFTPQAALGANKKNKVRAIEVRPGKKAVDGEVAEITPEDAPFDPYLPSHVEAPAKKNNKKKANLPMHVQIQQDDSLTEEERAEQLKKDRNYRKRQRAKRAKARDDTQPIEERKAKEPTPAPKKAVVAPVAAESPAVLAPAAKKQKKASKSPKPAAAQERKEEPPQQQQPKQESSSKKKKNKKKQKQRQQQVEEEEEATSSSSSEEDEEEPEPQPQQTSSKKKKSKSPKADNKKQEKQKEDAALFDKKQSKKKKKQKAGPARRANKQKNKEKQRQSEEEAIDALFEQNKAAWDKQRQEEAGLITTLYNWILSFCKAPPATKKRKLKH